jgi:hypothetical protein
MKEEHYLALAAYLFIASFGLIDQTLFLMLVVGLSVSELTLIFLDMLAGMVKQWKALAALDKAEP